MVESHTLIVFHAMLKSANSLRHPFYQTSCAVVSLPAAYQHPPTRLIAAEAHGRRLPLPKTLLEYTTYTFILP